MYRVTCLSCSKPFDATKAEECSCLQPALRDFAVDAYLTKPVNPADLRAAVGKYLGSGAGD